ncbi:hypothetical protein OROGR_016784 [Orobanche gracilis]
MHTTSLKINNMLHSTSSFMPLKQSPSFYCPSLNSHPKICLPTSRSIIFPYTSSNPPLARRFSIVSTVHSNQHKDSVVHFEDFVEKDWSFLDTDNDGEFMKRIDQIISAGKIEETSNVLVSISSEALVDRVVYSSPCQQLFVVHDSLLILACIKEKYDNVKCWQGEVINVPEKWTSFDTVFLYFLPAMSFELDQLLAALAKRCLPGARLVISHPQGRQVAEEQRQKYPDIVVSSLPEKMTLQRSAVDHSFEVVEFVDEPGFYLAVLRFNPEPGNY